MQPEPTGRSFEIIVGRALVDAEYRTRLTSSDEEEQVVALMEAGLSEAAARGVLPQLNEAAAAIQNLADNEFFGVNPRAA
jgi:hypothetical protein